MGFVGSKLANAHQNSVTVVVIVTRPSEPLIQVRRVFHNKCLCIGNERTSW